MRLQRCQQKSVAYADLLGIEGFDHRRDKLRQADTLVLSIYFYVRTGPAKDCCSLKAKIINNRQLPGLVFAKLTFDGHAAPGWSGVLGTACSCSQSAPCSSSEGIHAFPVRVQGASAAGRKFRGCQGPLVFYPLFNLDDIGILKASELHRQIAS